MGLGGTTVLTLDDGMATVSIDPRQGGSIGHHTLRSGREILSVGGEGRSGAFALGSQVLLPFANRLAGGFHHGGQFVPLSPNMPGEPFPIHGNASGLAWSVLAAESTRAALVVQSCDASPFVYAARLVYELQAGALTATLEVTNTGQQDLPYGLGFHPWFTRTPKSLVRFAASGFWTETAEHLPLDFLPVAVGQMGDGRHQPLPRDFCNTAYAGWPGHAELIWPEYGAGVRITAQGTGVLMIYSPGASADFVCIEPVSHTVDAHNRSGPGVVKPKILAPGESLGASMTMTPFSLA